MQQYQTTAIILARTNFGEADRILRVLTPQHGKLSVIAKGVRKIKSRSAGHLELFGETQLTLTKGRNLDIITSAKLTWYPHQLAANYDQLQSAYAAARLIDRIAQERHEQPELYAHLREMLRALNETTESSLMQLWFELRLLGLMGLRPELTHCLVCGRDDANTSYGFDAARGGLVCTADAPLAGEAMPHATIKLWRLMLDYPFATISHISGGPQLAAASLADCRAFYLHHLGYEAN